MGLTRYKLHRERIVEIAKFQIRINTEAYYGQRQPTKYAPWPDAIWLTL
jgi:hypothetical protein